jgi:hypothetical protein
VSEVFVLLACGASFDVFCDPCFGAWPEVFSIDTPGCFVSSGVTVGGSLVPYVHQFTFQSLIWWYNKASAFNVSPEGFIRVVNVFDWVDAFPFFHQRAVVVLNDGDGVFD